jgi:hypothetical protein
MANRVNRFARWVRTRALLHKLELLEGSSSRTL